MYVGIAFKKIIKMKLNKKVEDELDKQFPKGDLARGKALVLHSIAQIELDKKDEQIERYEKLIDEYEDEFNIVSGKDAERFIKKMKQERKGKVSKRDMNKIKNFKKFEEFMKMSHIEQKKKLFTLDMKPKCFYCDKPMENAYDTTLKKKSEYLWKPTCNCIKNKNFRLCVG